ncbi:MAG: hypothetical protein LBT97_03045 [Planctomycetota bacterium]|jgi:hypothetical protein|nr:hypothetical protein [Planctomycetota bacterium]
MAKALDDPLCIKYPEGTKACPYCRTDLVRELNTMAEATGHWLHCPKCGMTGYAEDGPLDADEIAALVARDPKVTEATWSVTMGGPEPRGDRYMLGPGPDRLSKVMKGKKIVEVRRTVRGGYTHFIEMDDKSVWFAG